MTDDFVNDVLASATDIESLVKFAEANPKARDLTIIARIMQRAEEAYVSGDDYLAAQYNLIALVLTGGADPDTPSELKELLVGFGFFKSGEHGPEEIRATRRRALRVIEEPFWTDLHIDVAISALDIASAFLAELGKTTRNQALLEKAIGAAHQAYIFDTGDDSRDATLANSLGQRWADLHGVTGDPDHLTTAVVAHRKAIGHTSASSEEYPEYLRNLSVCLSELYRSTGDRSHLEEAVELARTALDYGVDDQLARLMSNLAMRLLELSRYTQDQSSRGEAVRLLKRADKLDDGTNALARLNLAGAITANRSSLDLESITIALDFVRKAMDGGSLSPDDLVRAIRQLADIFLKRHSLTGELADLKASTKWARAAFASGGSPSSRGFAAATLIDALTTKARTSDNPPPDGTILDEAAAVAQEIVESWDSLGSEVHLALGQRLGHLARLRGSPGDAVAHYEQAYNTLQREATRLAKDRSRRHELAGRAPGLLSDLIAARALSGNIKGACAAAESERLWLPAPDASLEASAQADEVAVTVIVSTQSETIVMSGESHALVSVEVCHDEIANAAYRVMASARRGKTTTQTRRLFDLTTAVTEHLPQAKHLLLIPVGISGLLPFTVGRTSSGSHLIERSTVTVAPSASWANASRRSRPAGPSFAAFHPGHNPQDALDLSADRATFERTHRGADLLDLPTSSEVLDRLRSDCVTAHVSSHASFDIVDPLGSYLELADPLTLSSILGKEEAPWLINLSACETGVADPRTLEQTISFPSAFLLAGAAHVIATQWSVSDHHASTFNEQFYSELAAGAHPADAHRTAVLALAADDPFFWGCFNHVGSPPDSQ